MKIQIRYRAVVKKGKLLFPAKLVKTVHHEDIRDQAHLDKIIEFNIPHANQEFIVESICY